MRFDKLPKVSGGGLGEAYLSPRARAVLEAAFAEATKMRDKYVSIENIFLAIAEEKQGTAAGILSRAGCTRDSILKVLLEIRGTQRITDPNPEEKYIDELHTVVGAGAAEGAVDASNMLKPALARGTLRCVGATTLNEYRKYTENSLSLEILKGNISEGPRVNAEVEGEQINFKSV